MDKNTGDGPRLSANFRSTLRRELTAWTDAGLIEPHQATTLSTRYRLDELASGSGGLLVQALYLIGACLIGGGAISFVAARWPEIPIPARVALLISTLLACETVGFYLWQISAKRKKLGEALVVLGALVFGANVVLISQMFELHGAPYGAVGLWSLGAAAIAATATLLCGLGLWLDRGESTRRMAVVARVAGISAMLIFAYAMSFHEGPANELAKQRWQSSQWLWTAPLGLVYLAAIAVWSALLRKPPHRADLRHRSPAILLAGILLTAGTLTMQPVGLAIGANLALAAIAVSLLYTAIKTHRRTSFWSGLLLLALVIFNRFIDWDTQLLLKSLVFIAGGIAVIVGGIRFERHRQDREYAND